MRIPRKFHVCFIFINCLLIIIAYIAGWKLIWRVEDSAEIKHCEGLVLDLNRSGKIDDIDTDALLLYSLHTGLECARRTYWFYWTTVFFFLFAMNLLLIDRIFPEHSRIMKGHFEAFHIVYIFIICTYIALSPPGYLRNNLIAYSVDPELQAYAVQMIRGSDTRLPYDLDHRDEKQEVRDESPLATDVVEKSDTIDKRE